MSGGHQLLSTHDGKRLLQAAAQLGELAFPRISPATGFSLVRGSLLDAGGNPYGVDLNNFRFSHENSVVDAGRFSAHSHAALPPSGNRTLSDIDRDCFYSRIRKPDDGKKI